MSEEEKKVINNYLFEIEKIKDKINEQITRIENIERPTSSDLGARYTYIKILKMMEEL